MQFLMLHAADWAATFAGACRQLHLLLKGLGFHHKIGQSHVLLARCAAPTKCMFTICLGLTNTAGISILAENIVLVHVFKL